jgi:hypothetical protein
MTNALNLGEIWSFALSGGTPSRMPFGCCDDVLVGAISLAVCSPYTSRLDANRTHRGRADGRAAHDVSVPPSLSPADWVIGARS